MQFIEKEMFEMNNELYDLNNEDLSNIDGGFAVSLGFTIAVCVEAFGFVASEIYLYNQNKALNKK